MPVNKALVDKIESTIVKDFSYSYDELKKLHSQMLDQITSTASQSPAYSRIEHISDISQLSKLPLTSFDRIQELYDQLGTDKVLLKKPAIYWYTSGSTGKQKKVYYSEADHDIIAQGFMQLLYLSGVRVTDSPWVFTSTGGDTLFGRVLTKYGIPGLISTLASEMDVIKALRNASKLDRIDITVGVTWLYLVIHKIAHHPEEFEKIVQKLVKDKVKVPGLSWLIYKYLMRDIDYPNLAKILSETRLGFSHAEALAPYIPKIKEAYPKMEMHDVFGATEQWIQAIQVSTEHNWLSFFLRYSIPELADPEEVLKAKQDPAYNPKTTPWYEWKKGMRGELILTRPGECLPLIRYPTGDMIEVMDPAYKFTAKLETVTLDITLPAIMSLGRATDSVDYDSGDQNGNFFGFKVYSRQINDALFKIPNIRWWELYHIRGTPGRFIFLVIPEAPVQDKIAFQAEIHTSLTKTFVEYYAVDTGRQFILDQSSANGNGVVHKELIEVIVTTPAAYNVVDREVKRRMREGRAMGRQKPKRIFKVENEAEFKRLVEEKLKA